MKKRIKYIIFFVLFVTLPVCFGTLIVGIIQLKKSYDISGNLNKYKLYDSVVDTISTLVTDGSASATYYIEIKEKRNTFGKV